MKFLTYRATILITGALLFFVICLYGVTLIGSGGGISVHNSYGMPTIAFPQLPRSYAPWSLPSSTAAVLPYGGVDVGFHYTLSGMASMPAPDYWYNVGKDASGKFNGSDIGAIWVVGLAQADGNCYLTFPSSGQHSGILFSGSDQNEQYLNYFDSKGMKVFLQVEPGQADVSTLIRLVLDKYGKHPCVAGFGVDVEWLQFNDNLSGRQVTDQEAARWYDLIASYNPGYMLALTHWETSKMPPTYRDGIYFLYDGPDFKSLGKMVSKCAAWGESYPDNPVGFYLGFPADKSWWGKYDDPYYQIGSKLLERVKNTKGLYWVSFSIKDIYPA